jgi:predicted amidohydrolase
MASFTVPIRRVRPMCSSSERRLPKLGESIARPLNNTARILKLNQKGTLDPAKDADVTVLRGDSLEIVEVIAGGRRLIAQGRLKVQEPFWEKSKRKLSVTS